MLVEHGPAVGLYHTILSYRRAVETLFECARYLRSELCPRGSALWCADAGPRAQTELRHFCIVLVLFHLVPIDARFEAYFPKKLSMPFKAGGSGFPCCTSGLFMPSWLCLCCSVLLVSTRYISCSSQEFAGVGPVGVAWIQLGGSFDSDWDHCSRLLDAAGVYSRANWGAPAVENQERFCLQVCIKNGCEASRILSHCRTGSCRAFFGGFGGR